MMQTSSSSLSSVSSSVNSSGIAACSLPQSNVNMTSINSQVVSGEREHLESLSISL